MQQEGKMALREERPADFTDEERWGTRWLSTSALIAALVLIAFSAGICKLCAVMHILPVGIVFSIFIVVFGTVIFILPVPEGDLWHGQGTIFARILARIIVHAVTSGIFIRHLPLMGDDPLIVRPEKPKKRRRTGKKDRKTEG